MGGGQNDKRNAGISSQGAYTSAQNSLNISQEDQKHANDIYGMLFGQGSPMTRFLSGADLNNSNLSGVYKQGFDETVRQGEKESGNAYRGIVRQANNNGLGISSGLSFDAARKNALERGGMKGSAYASAVGAQHDEALRNFWGAADSAGQAGNTLSGVASNASGNAGQTYSNIYGTAGAYHQSPMAGIIGAGIGAGGNVGAAAALCPTKDCMIETHTVSMTRAADLLSDYPIKQICGSYSHLEGPVSAVYERCVRVKTRDGKSSKVGERHAYLLTSGGYVYAKDAQGCTVKSSNGSDEVISVTPAGMDYVYPLRVGGDHTYCCDGLWSLE